MKANRKFVMADDAVSPVIAVILMVAITVVLAATVFVLVSDIGQQSGSTAPTFNLRQDETTDTLKVDSKTPQANWNRLEIRPSADINFELDSASGTDVVSTPAGNGTFTAITTTSTPMEAGDELCFSVDTTPATNVKIEMRDAVASQTIGQGWTFSSIGLILQC